MVYADWNLPLMYVTLHTFSRVNNRPVIANFYLWKFLFYFFGSMNLAFCEENDEKSVQVPFSEITGE